MAWRFPSFHTVAFHSDGSPASRDPTAIFLYILHPGRPSEGGMLDGSISDRELLDQFRGGSEPAFAALVKRHLTWVQTAALRQVRDVHLADDVVQSVFIILARKGARLSPATLVGPWLFKVTRFACWEALRSAKRRAGHERSAAAMRTTSSPPAAREWSDLSLVLDELVARLRPADRRAIILRFYQQQSIDEVAVTMGISPPAARKRIDRAIERLRQHFHRRGVHTTSASLGSAMIAHTTRDAATATAVHAASVTAGALSAGGGAHPLVLATLGAMMKSKLIAAAAVAILLLAVPIVCFIARAPRASALAAADAGPRVVGPAAQQIARAPVRAPVIAGYPIARGWPVALPGAITATPTVADLDGDGKLEIIVPCMARDDDPPYVHPSPDHAALLYALRPDGTLLPGWPAELVSRREREDRESGGYFIASWSSSPSVCADGKGKPWVVITTPYFLGIRAVDGAGGVRRYRGGSQWASVPLADVNRTGTPQIVTGAGMSNLDGSPMTGWPRQHPINAHSGFAGCVGDANRDGRLEIFHLFAGTSEPPAFFTGTGGEISEIGGFDRTGAPLPGWPRKVDSPYLRPPVMGDVSGDGKMEIVGAYGHLFVWTSDGKGAPGTSDEGELTGILKSDVVAKKAPPTLADLDGDGKAEIIVYDHDLHAVRAWHGDGRPAGASADGVIAVLDVPENANSPDALPWAGVSVADLGGDGIIDLFCGASWIKFDPRTSASTTTPLLPAAPAMDWTQPTIADIDGDGKADIILGLADGRVIVYNTTLAYVPQLVQWPTVSGNFQHTGVWTPPPVASHVQAQR
jgi:RNA polymerase sigma factor (sigma-70 family)